MLDFKNSELN